VRLDGLARIFGKFLANLFEGECDGRQNSKYPHKYWGVLVGLGHREVVGTLNRPIRLYISSETRGANVATEISAELYKSEQHQLLNCLYNAARMAG
jgi:hypothetical protein